MNEYEFLGDVAIRVKNMYANQLKMKEKTPPEEFGENVAAMIAEEYGGMNLYIPKTRQKILRKRNNTIYKEFRGDNISFLAMKYGVSEQQIYKILAQEREKHKIGQGNILDFV